MSGEDDLVGGEGVAALALRRRRWGGGGAAGWRRRRWRLALGGGQIGAESDQAQDQGRKPEGSAHRRLLG